MPKLWDETIEAHRRAVRDATLDATAALVAEHGLRAVTMSEIAKETGIGRATLYKYFPDVETILAAWHRGQIAHHLEHLAKIRDRAAQPRERLEAVLTAFARIQRDRVRRHHSQPHGSELTAVLHRDEQALEAEQQLHVMLRDLIAEAVRVGEARSDVPADELASYCIHALEAAGHAPSEAGIERMVTVVMDGLNPGI